MQLRSAAIVAIFLITIGFMVLIAYFIPGFVGRGTTFLIITFIVVALILAGIITAVVSLLSKAPPQRTEMVGKRLARPEYAPPPAIDEKVIQVLSLLQRKGRLIDFFQEDISAYDDSQIGAAVRNIHKGCREAILEHIVLKPVRNESEGEEVTIEEGFDPSAIRLTGNVIGSPPFKGILRHSGWQAEKTTMPPIPQNQDKSIIEPAEVEI